MSKGIIYYTDNELHEPIFSTVQKLLLETGLPIVSVSLRPINFGKNYVVAGPPGYPTMVAQIVKALEESESDCVFFCEHDVLYPKSHFEFTPAKDSLFYYNTNILRWDYPKNRAVSYNRLISLSSLCVNRKFALNHYKMRLSKIKSGNHESDALKNPHWARLWGYEPGTKKKRRGGLTNDDFEIWQSPIPIVDIRHDNTFSLRKVTRGAFKHLPKNWKEATLDKIHGWDLGKLFNINL